MLSISVAGLDATTSGTYCFDAFESSRGEYIGTLEEVQGCTAGGGDSEELAGMVLSLPVSGLTVAPTGETVALTNTVNITVSQDITSSAPITLSIPISGTYELPTGETTVLTTTATITVTDYLTLTVPVTETGYLRGIGVLALFMPDLKSMPKRFIKGSLAMVETSQETIITYDYDPLYRLTSATYDDGSFAGYSYGYDYDAVGNRTTKSYCPPFGPCQLTTSTYDVANRIDTVDDGSGPITYDWDDNGNLLYDGNNGYAYDYANRLKTVSNLASTFHYTYNGLGDRLQQEEEIGPTFVTTNYTLDLAAGLTQILVESPEIGVYDNTYLYGLDRIAQQNTMGTDYFLPDALGSVRQLTDASGAVTLTKSYTPYGEVLSTDGDGTSSYGFTGEWTDSYIKLIYLRSRYYAPETGRFITRDTWQGDYNRPLSLNRWNYVEGNPVNYVDPTGKWVCTVDSLLFNPNCTEWVEDALDQLENGGTIGRRVAATFHELDRKYKLISLGSCFHPPLANHLLGIKIAFVPNPGVGMVLPGTILLNPDYINGPKATGFGLATFAHEISHLEQGVTNAFSMQAEMLTAILRYQLEDEIGEAHYLEGQDIVAKQWNPWDDNDLRAFKTHPNWKKHFTPFPLRPIWGDLPKDWLDQWGTTFPYPIFLPTNPPRPTPLPVPTPPPPSGTPVP